MLPRFILTLALLALPLSACGSASSNSTAVKELDRQHEELMKTMTGGGGGGGGSGGSM